MLQFKFDSILHEASQEDVFEVCVCSHGVRQALVLPTRRRPSSRQSSSVNLAMHCVRVHSLHAQVCAAGMVRQALEGYNGCIMCYGQTGECHDKLS